MKEFIIGLIFAGIVGFGMLPAVASNDPAVVDQAAAQTIDRVIDFGTQCIVDEVKGLPIEVATDELLK